MPTKTPRGGRGTRPLSEVARHVVIPEGIVDTLWFDVEKRCREFGIEFDVWQDGLGQAILGIREDGLFAATVGGVTLSIPRQVAKTFIVMCIVVALCTLHPNLTVLWTAHRTRTATNTFQKIKAMCLRPAVKPFLRAGMNRGTGIRDANGEQEIPFANGSKILFGARESGFGRGFDEVDVEVFDEAQILTIKALEDMVAATNQSRFEHGALLFYMGTPPRPGVDPGDMFAARRREALELKKGLPDFGGPVAAGDALYVECSADPNVGQPGGPSLDDPSQVEKANPSYPHRTPKVAVDRLRKNLPDDSSWRREGLGVWDEFAAETLFSRQVWMELAPHDKDGNLLPAAPVEGARSYGVKFSPDGATAALSVAIKPAGDGPVFVETIEHLSLAMGTSELVSFCAERWRDALCFVVDGKAHAGAFVQALIDAGVPKPRPGKLENSVIVDLSTRSGDVVAAHSAFLELFKRRGLTHAGQEGLADSVACAARRPIGTTGGWGLQSVSDTGDVTPVESVILAVHGVLTSKRMPGQRSRAVLLT